MSDTARAILIHYLASGISLAANLYFIIVMLVIVMSWIQVDPNQPVVRFLRRLVDPPCLALRRALPFLIAGGIDLSPIVLLLLVQLAESALLRLLGALLAM